MEEKRLIGMKGEGRIEGNVEREGGWSRGRKESEGEGERGGELWIVRERESVGAGRGET